MPAENVDMMKGVVLAQIEDLFATTDLETEKEMFKALANLLLTVPGVQADGLPVSYTHLTLPTKA